MLTSLLLALVLAGKAPQPLPGANKIYTEKGIIVANTILVNWNEGSTPTVTLLGGYDAQVAGWTRLYVLHAVQDKKSHTWHFPVPNDPRLIVDFSQVTLDPFLGKVTATVPTGLDQRVVSAKLSISGMTVSLLVPEASSTGTIYHLDID